MPHETLEYRKYILGSYARRKADGSGDLDFYIEVSETMGLIQYIGFILELEDKFGCHVNVLSGEIDDRNFYDNILNNRIYIYATRSFT